MRVTGHGNMNVELERETDPLPAKAGMHLLPPALPGLMIISIFIPKYMNHILHITNLGDVCESSNVIRCVIRVYCVTSG